MKNERAVEILGEMLVSLRVQHMMKDIDGELEDGEVEMYKDRFEALNIGIMAIDKLD